MDSLETSFIAMFWVLDFAAAAKIPALERLSGKDIDHCSACIPPRLPPATKCHLVIPRKSVKSFCELTQSTTDTIGKSLP